MCECETVCVRWICWKRVPWHRDKRYISCGNTAEEWFGFGFGFGFEFEFGFGLLSAAIQSG